MNKKILAVWRCAICIAALALLATWSAPLARAQSAWQSVGPGVVRHVAVIKNLRGAAETLWVYEPSNPNRGKLPCVLIAPAGTPLIYGNQLGNGDMPEHIPYAQAGYVVVAYSLDGAVADSNHLSVGGLVAAATAFANANFGLTDAESALDYALRAVPNI